MMEEINDLLDRYVKWVKDKTMMRQVENWVEITSPYIDRHNDYLQIYARRENGSYILTDDGYVLEDLAQSGCKLETAKRPRFVSAQPDPQRLWGAAHPRNRGFTECCLPHKDTRGSYGGLT